MKGDDIADRFLDFAVRVLRLAAALPKTLVGQARRRPVDPLRNFCRARITKKHAARRVGPISFTNWG